MPLKYKKIVQCSVFISIMTTIATFPAHADLKSYQPTNADSAYNISFSATDENSYDLAIYEEVNGQWQKKYYNYEYQIKNCPDNSCSSDNRFIPNRTTVDLNTNFYGIEYGAIYNNGFQIGTVIADFIKNNSYLGAAILNRGSNKITKITSLTGDFINNTATSSGGAIYNDGQVDSSGNCTAVIGDIKGNFVGNTSKASGGAIYNNVDSLRQVNQIGDIHGLFIDNRAIRDGGAIYNQGGFGNFYASFIANSSGGNGGAIMSTRIIGDIVGDFISNTAARSGGALYFSNGGTVGHIIGRFIGNTAGEYGGAIRNSSAKDFSVSGEFALNSAKYGGAIYNSSLANVSFPLTSTIINSSFINNSAEIAGGAIYHRGVINIIADGYNSVFQGNTAAGASSAIFVNESFSKVNLFVRNHGNITFYDDIDGVEGYDFNLQGENGSGINFYANINNGDIYVGDINKTISENADVYFENISNIGNRNNSLIINNGKLIFNDFAGYTHNFRELQLNNGEIHINNVDADLTGAVMGKFSADYYTADNISMKIHNINVIADGDERTLIDFADSSFSDKVENNVSTAGGPVYNYNVIYQPETGQFMFERTSVNPQVNVSSYAAVAAASILNDEIYSRVLADIDSYFQVDDGVRKIKPMIKVFASDDDIDLKNDVGGKSKFQGIIAGAETSPITHTFGWKSVYNIYMAYAAGNHKISSQKLNQKTGYFGLSGILFKNRFFVGTTLNAAVTENIDKSNARKINFMSYQAGAAVKAGYNIDWGTDYYLQPFLYGSYTYISSNNYKTEKEAVVKFGNTYNIELSPGIKMSKKFENNLSLYLTGCNVFNFNGRRNVTANKIKLPKIKLKNYAEFGAGVEKFYLKKNAKFFVEIVRREGGREGWNALAGITWNF